MVIATGPNIFTASVSAYHPVLPLPPPCCCPDVGTAVVPVPPPIPFPPPILFYSIRFPPIITLCSACSFVPELGVLPSAGNVVACFVNRPAAPPGIPSFLGADVSAFSFPQP